ncbi:MAG: response regulator [Candidatus Hodarchaeota archaeon]
MYEKLTENKKEKTSVLKTNFSTDGSSMKERNKTTRILFVDDDKDFLAICKEFLEAYESNFLIETSNSATDVLRILSERQFDVVISDYKMPGMNGIELLICSRAMGVTAPFILFTGQIHLDFLPLDAVTREGVEVQSLSLGVVYYLLKCGYPESQYALINIIQRVMTHNGRKEVFKEK